MTDQDYVDFCNIAFDIDALADAYFRRFSDEEIEQISGFIRNQRAATATGKVSLPYDFLADAMAEEIERRKTLSKPTKMEASHDLPF